MSASGSQENFFRRESPVGRFLEEKPEQKPKEDLSGRPKKVAGFRFYRAKFDFVHSSR
jgi:hypothetical protein